MLKPASEGVRLIEAEATVRAADDPHAIPVKYKVKSRGVLNTLAGRLVCASAARLPDFVTAPFRRSRKSQSRQYDQNLRSGRARLLPPLARIRTARNRILLALLVYGAISLVVTALLARFVSRPLTQLQSVSRRVASGDTTMRLATSSGLIEIANLSNDLELMRTELVGAADRLRREMQQRQVEHEEKAALQNQLRHEQRLATVGTFAGGLAHEFNNILVPLIPYAEESLDEIGEHAARTSLERILAAATRASSLVSRVLAFSRPVGQPQLEPVEWAGITRDALQLSRPLVPVYVDMQQDIDAANFQVLGDTTLLTQIVLNLCSNAVQAMEPKGGTLTVSLKPVEEKTGQGSNPARAARPGQRTWYDGRYRRADLRAIPHDSGCREGFGTRLVSCARYRGQSGRPKT